MLKKGHLENCYRIYKSDEGRLPKYHYLGYMEACLVQFGVIESRSDGLRIYSREIEKKFLFWTYKGWEGRESIILRLTEEFLGIGS